MNTTNDDNHVIKTRQENNENEKINEIHARKEKEKEEEEEKKNEIVNDEMRNKNEQERFESTTEAKHTKRLTLENLLKFDRTNSYHQMINLQITSPLDTNSSNENGHIIVMASPSPLPRSKEEDLEVLIDEQEKK